MLSLQFARNAAKRLALPGTSKSMQECHLMSAHRIGLLTTTRAFSDADLAGGDKLKALKKINPHIDVVKYHHKMRTWTFNLVDYYSEALAIGILENGLLPGDVVLSWLPSHFSEQMVIQFACSKAGLVLYTLDPEVAVHDLDAAADGLEAALELSQANVFISQEAGSDVNYIRIGERVIPELRFFSFSYGAPFITPRFPELRFCVQTGYDEFDKEGYIRLEHMLVPSDNLDNFVPKGTLSASTPLAGQFILNEKGIPTGLGKTLTNAEVLEKYHWPTYSKILNKEFHEIEGIGVVN